MVHRLPPTARPPSSTPGGATPTTRPSAPRDVNSFVIGSVSVPSDSVDADEIQVSLLGPFVCEGTDRCTFYSVRTCIYNVYMNNPFY